MDWNGNLRTFLSRPAESSLNLLYDYNYEQYPGMDINHQAMADTSHGLVPVMDKINYGSQDKKKRLTSDQLDSLERSFQEEIKLDPDRKMKLSRDLGLQPRQIAVWFQNRRARWKAKRIERLYDLLKQEFDVVSKEKQELQEEVMKLKAMIREQATRKQISAGYTEISGEETVESTSVAICGSGRQQRAGVSHHQVAECNFVPNNVDEYNTLSSSAYWAVLPTYP